MVQKTGDHILDTIRVQELHNLAVLVSFRPRVHGDRRPDDQRRDDACKLDKQRGHREVTSRAGKTRSARLQG